MKTEKFINAVSRAFWRRIEPYKNDFERELPENLPVQFQSFMGTALSHLDDKIKVLFLLYRIPSQERVKHRGVRIDV